MLLLPSGEAHPRTRGDHGVQEGDGGDAAGPPPHARGSPAPAHARASSTRPTPACAGITCRRGVRTWRRRAHPRMRGDHFVRTSMPIAVTGPPPHERGSLLTGSAGIGGPRPTPACAGITGTATRCGVARRAHPRMRGDHFSQAPARRRTLGPPPHARGSLRAVERDPVGDGPTPACAGITSVLVVPCFLISAHPRMRGDHVRMLRIESHARGPPPHARGSPVPMLRAYADQRPTPACAGITSRASPTAPCCTAHPRMRGDHTRTSVLCDWTEGPPPHARGSRTPGRGAAPRARPTPACAGITRKA